MNKITKRNIYDALINFTKTGTMSFFNEDEEIVISNEILANFAQNEIDLLNKKSAKAKERTAKRRAEGDELTDAVRAAMSTEEFESIVDIAARVADENATIAKVTYRLNALVTNGEAEKKEIILPAIVEGLKSRRVQGYKLIG